jgi:hypothetical protein
MIAIPSSGPEIPAQYTLSPGIMKPFNTPLLLIAWRRPDTLCQVIDAIRPIAPTCLFVACDGPNSDRPGEVEKVSATRALIKNEIDWPCQIEHLYSDVNQGCRLGVSRAITWFFEQVEEGIILEDDCVPHPDFLPYCTTLLERYRHDTRVWCISGNNFQNGQWRGDGSYYFSRYNHCWGWASWRRCWQHYDANLSQWPALRDSRLMKTIFRDPVERNYWSSIWQRLVDEGKPDTWDYQWTFTCIANGALTALPNRNLVSNVGFGKDATHTMGTAINTTIKLGIDPNQHPKFFLSNSLADRYTFNQHFSGRWGRFPFFILRSAKRAFASFASHLTSHSSFLRD